ncbi:MAG: glycoside hydrolase family 43 protein [Microbacter sp.]
MPKGIFFLLLICFCWSGFLFATRPVSQVWVPDLGNGYYKNPVIYADYSDPDVCRVGDDYYLVSSSFDAVPGLPILHSNDLVNWTIMGHALMRQPPYDHFAKTQHGGGVWAPAIRYHNGMFYIYYPDPDFGIYMVKAKDPAGSWSTPVLVMEGKGLEDPCPLWDSDGKVYLVHAYAGSRAGIRSILVMNQMNEAGTKVVNEGVIVYDGHGVDEGIEGPKLYKRNGYYYIFAPAGGFDHGWQVVLRSRNIYGPYERRVVMNQGKSDIAAPHQGGWVETQTGESWFLHFAQPTVYGRLVYLEPMHWINDWPIIGKDQGNGIGEPVDQYWMPNVGKKYPIATPQTSDDFNNSTLGLQWQWQANPQVTWFFPFQNQKCLRLYAQMLPPDFKNYWDVPNILMQKFPAPEFTVTAKVTFHPSMMDDKAGLIVMGMDYADLAVENGTQGILLTQNSCHDAEKGAPETVNASTLLHSSTLWLRVAVSQMMPKATDVAKPKVVCQFSYSLDGRQFVPFGPLFPAREGRWIGAKVGLFCTRSQWSNDAGFLDINDFLVEQSF